MSPRSNGPYPNIISPMSLSFERRSGWLVVLQICHIPICEVDMSVNLCPVPSFICCIVLEPRAISITQDSEWIPVFSNVIFTSPHHTKYMLPPLRIAPNGEGMAVVSCHYHQSLLCVHNLLHCLHSSVQGQGLTQSSGS